jgi:hypothetical protein
VREAIYQTTEDSYLPSTGGVVIVPLQCTQAGTVGNTPPDDGTSPNPLPVGQQFRFLDPVFDPSLASNIVSIEVGGGADVTSDDDLRRAARAMAQGRYAPTIAAIAAFALRGYGVRRAAVFEDPAVAVTRLLVADGSRYGSRQWCDRIKQGLYDAPAVGFGCRLEVRPAAPVWVSAQATILLRDANFRSYTTDITQNVSDAVARYFTLRDDFYTFRLSTLRGIVARADPRILTCTGVTITSPLGVPIAEPPAFVPGGPLPSAFYTLAQSGLQATYLNPS